MGRKESNQTDKRNLSHDMRFPTMWYVRPAKAQTSLRIRAVWSESLLVAWIFYECKANDWTAFGVSKLKRRLHRLLWVYTCQNTTLLEITCRGSFICNIVCVIILYTRYVLVQVHSCKCTVFFRVTTDLWRDAYYCSVGCVICILQLLYYYINGLGRHLKSTNKI